MSKIRIGVAVFLALLVAIWSIPSMAGDHAISVQWTGPTTEILNDNCALAGQPLTGAVSYTVQFRKVGTTSWTTLETINTHLEVNGLLAQTEYEVRIGAHYIGGPVLCWTEPETVTTAADQPPAACTNVVVTPLE